MLLRPPAYALPGVAILAFVAFLGFALFRLFLVEQDMRDNVDENMLWVVAQAQVASHRLEQAVSRQALEHPHDDPALRLDVLFSRLGLMDEGPQRRYLEQAGLETPLDDALARLGAIDALMQPPAEDAAEHARAIQRELDPLMAGLNRIATGVMKAEWEYTGGRLDAYRANLWQVIASAVGILACGLLLIGLLIHALRQRRTAQQALAAHRDQLEDEVERHIGRYRQTAAALARSLKREKGVSEFYRSFAAMVSHQFRTPLAVIDSGLQRLIRRQDDMAPAQRLERYHRLREEVAQMTRLVDSSLTAARLDGDQVESSPAACSLTDQVAQACRLQREAHGESRLRVSESQASLEAWCDPSLVEQILANLLSNALKYSPASEPVDVCLGTEGSWVYCCIEDRGIGIPDEELAHLFERFFRSGNARGISGLGLGLNIARHLARLQNGDITVSSVEGEGTVFTLWLPAVTRRHQDVEPH